MGHRVRTTVVGGAATPLHWEPGDIGPNHLRAQSAPVRGMRAQVDVDACAYRCVGVIMAGGGGRRGRGTAGARRPALHVRGLPRCVPRCNAGQAVGNRGVLPARSTVDQPSLMAPPDQLPLVADRLHEILITGGAFDAIDHRIPRRPAPTLRTCGRREPEPPEPRIGLRRAERAHPLLSPLVRYWPGQLPQTGPAPPAPERDKTPSPRR